MLLKTQKSHRIILAIAIGLMLTVGVSSAVANSGSDSYTEQTHKCKCIHATTTSTTVKPTTTTTTYKPTTTTTTVAPTTTTTLPATTTTTTHKPTTTTTSTTTTTTTTTVKPTTTTTTSTTAAPTTTTTTTAPPVTVQGTVVTTPPTTVPVKVLGASVELPFTGSQSVFLALISISLLTAGILLLMINKKRQPRLRMGIDSYRQW